MQLHRPGVLTMLSFTAAGAVATPTTVQIRVTRSFPGRVAAGAPVPARSLTADELRDNVHYFAVQRAGPRTRACDALVLSGLSLGDRPTLGALLADARSWGIGRITVHATPADLSALDGLGADAAAVTVRSPSSVGELGGHRLSVTAVVPLIEEVLECAEDLGAALAAVRPSRVVLTWPFPGSVHGRPPAAHQAALAVPRLLAPLDAAGITAGVKGLPACALGSAVRLWRSHNRWYVDAEHQRDAALMFFPDVVRFAKGDVCRYCPAEPVCDGAPAQWLAEGLAGQLQPLD